MSYWVYCLSLQGGIFDTLSFRFVRSAFVRVREDCALRHCGISWVSLIINDRFYLSFFVATHGFRESDFDYY